MRRAASLVVFVVLITAGVWWFLPAAGATTTVFYQRIGGESEQAEDQLQPVFSEQSDWRLSLDRITQTASASRGLALFSTTEATFITLLLNTKSPSIEDTPMLVVCLLDDLGRQYADPQLVECSEYATQDRVGWRYLLRFPALAPGAKSVTILASTAEASFRLAELPLP